MTRKVINTFLDQMRQQEHEEGAVPNTTVVDNLEKRLWGPTKELRGGQTTLQSPFAGANFVTIRDLLQQTKDTTGSPLYTDWFLVLDDQSEQTSTAVIIHVEDDDVQSVRVAYPVASRYLSAASIAHPPLDELIEIANEEGDGVMQD